MQLRYYQQEAVDACYAHLSSRRDNPLIVIPTAGGKTPVMASICRDIVAHEGSRVLVLAHVKELLQQTAETLRAFAPELFGKTGVYSAGLKSRDTQQQIIVAGIQSVHKKACDLGRFDLIMVDECHLIPTAGEGMYRSFLEDAKIINPNVRVVGLTATPYRMKGGLIASAEHFLNHVCYEVGVKELMLNGYISTLKSKAGKTHANLDGIHIQRGEFVASEVAEAYDRFEVLEPACGEVLAITADRKSVLFFCASVDHAQYVQMIIELRTKKTCGIVTGETPADERADILKKFKAGEIKYLTNVNVLTTGFDATIIDTVVLLRPTNSPGLYYQMVGRGFRLHEGKTDCLVLDYGENIIRHGPVDDLQIKGPSGRSSGGQAPAKECPKCLELIAAGFGTCPACGFVFPPPESETSLQDRASGAAIVSGQTVDTEYTVLGVDYNLHVKRGAAPDAPRTLKVSYRVSLGEFQSEWVCLEHSGFARVKAEKWWQRRSEEPVPDTIDDALTLIDRGALSRPSAIRVRETGGKKFPEIIDYELNAPAASVSCGDLAEPIPPDPWDIPDDDLPF